MKNGDSSKSPKLDNDWLVNQQQHFQQYQAAQKINRLLNNHDENMINDLNRKKNDFHESISKKHNHNHINSLILKQQQQFHQSLKGDSRSMMIDESGSSGPNSLQMQMSTAVASASQMPGLMLKENQLKYDLPHHHMGKANGQSPSHNGNPNKKYLFNNYQNHHHQMPPHNNFQFNGSAPTKYEPQQPQQQHHNHHTASSNSNMPSSSPASSNNSHEMVPMMSKSKARSALY